MQLEHPKKYLKLLITLSFIAYFEPIIHVDVNLWGSPFHAGLQRHDQPLTIQQLTQVPFFDTKQ